MNDKLTKVFAAAQALAGACIIGAVKLWSPVCSKMLELQNGKEVHMKCFYAGQAGVIIGLILLVIGVLALINKSSSTGLLAVGAVCGIGLFMVFGNFIGVCGAEGMLCRTTAVWGKVCGAIAVVAFAASILTSKKGQIE